MANKRKKTSFKRSNDDISRKTLAVFVAIVVIVSVVGTWLILTNNVALKSSDLVQGRVKLSIEDPGKTPEIINAKPVGGQVKLTVEKPN